MIYKDDLRVLKVEIEIQPISNWIVVHLHLSDERVWTYKPLKVDPVIFHNAKKCELATLNLLAKALVKFKEIQDND